MNSLLNLVWMYAVISIAMWAVGNVLAMAMSRLLKPSDCTKQERRRLWILASLPVTIPFTFVFSLILLSGAKYFGLIDDHCLHHQQHHPHFCFIHLPQILLNAAESMTAFLMVGLAGLAIGYNAVKHSIQHAKASTLKRLVKDQQLLKVISSSEPFAFTLGIKNPVIYLSSGLKNLLSKRQQRIVAAHEVAHIRHGDVLKNSVFELFLSLHTYKASLRDRWRFVMEASADDKVAERFDSLEIAETLIKLQRAKIHVQQPVSIAGANINTRIHRLIEPKSAPSNFMIEALIVLAIAGIPVIMISNHHSLETFLGWWLV